MKLVKELNKSALESEISDKEAEEAFVKILKYIGEDPGREGLLETPKELEKHSKNISKVIKRIHIKFYQKHLEMLMDIMIL